MISEFGELIRGIHMIFSIFWWSITFVVIFIIRPANTTGNLSIVLPKIRKVVIFASTVSIISGLIQFGMLFNFNIPSFINSAGSILIVISGFFSLIVYYHILFVTHRGLPSPKPKILAGIVSAKIIPYLMFGLLSATMVSMIIVSSFAFL